MTHSSRPPTPSGSQEVPARPEHPRIRIEWNAERIRLVRDRLETFSFDVAGRLSSWARGGVTWRRGLDGTVVEIHRAEPPPLFEARRLPAEEAAMRVAEVRVLVAEAWKALGQPSALLPALESDPEREAERFRAVWRPVMILPPDQYRSLVLQLTEGCSYNLCAFCTFYQGRPYRVRSLQEFGEHVDRAVEFLGPALSWRRGIFLADANAASLPFEELACALDLLRQRFPLPGPGERHPWDFDRVASFLDTFTALRRTADEWRTLRGMGLRSLYLGVETGSLEVLRLLGKPGHPDRVAEFVVRLKEAGMRVGLIVMTGVGGRVLAREHVVRTADLLNSLPLDRDDRIYLSEFAPDPRSRYVAEGRAELLGRGDCRAQAGEIRARLRLPAFPEGPLIIPYDVRQFVY